MAGNPDNLARSFQTENTGGLLSGLLAEEDPFDRRTLWRLGSWGVATVGAVIVAVIAGQSSLAVRRDEIAAADLARQSQQIQSVAKESQNETRRLASAIDTLNGDRDRLYSRVTVLEQGLDSVTGALTRPVFLPASPQTKPLATAEPPPDVPPTPAPVVTPVATTAARTAEKPVAVSATAPEAAPTAPKEAAQPPAAQVTPLPAPAASVTAAKSAEAPPDTAAGKPIEPAAAPADVRAAAPQTMAVTEEPAPPQAPSQSLVQRTEFGVDVGGANSIGGLRALWRGLLRSNTALAPLRPLIFVREGNNGLGMQLRLVAGPIVDASAAAKICAGLIESERPCTTTTFDGQRLALKADEPVTVVKPVTRPVPSRKGSAKRVSDEEPEKKPEPSTLSTFFGRR